MISDPITALVRRILRAAAGHPGRLFLLMGMSVLLGSLLSLDLIQVAYSNFEFILEYGAMALMEGGAVQALELLAQGLLALACFVVFKCAEKLLVEALLDAGGTAASQEPDSRD